MGVIWTMTRVGICVDVDGCAVFDVGCDDVIPVSMVCSTSVFGSMGSLILCRGLGHGTRKGKQDCCCFKFPEESAISHGNSA